MVAGEHDGRPLQRERRCRRAIGRRHGRSPRRPRNRRAGGVHVLAPAPDWRRLRPPASRRVPEEHDSRTRLQESVSHGDVRVPR